MLSYSSDPIYQTQNIRVSWFKRCDTHCIDKNAADVVTLPQNGLHLFPDYTLKYGSRTYNWNSFGKCPIKRYLFCEELYVDIPPYTNDIKEITQYKKMAKMHKWSVVECS